MTIIVDKRHYAPTMHQLRMCADEKKAIFVDDEALLELLRGDDAAYARQFFFLLITLVVKGRSTSFGQSATRIMNGL